MRLSKILFEDQRMLNVLRNGLNRVAEKSHLVSEQIRQNIDSFFDNLNVENFIKKLGKPEEFLGAGVFGAVFKLSNGKVLKFTFDYHEAPFLHEISKNPIEGFVDVDKVVSFSFGDTTAYGIVRNDLTPITQTQYRHEAYEVIHDLKSGNLDVEYGSDIKNEIKNALIPMYNMDPNWRGTHVENLGIQNGRVVLYDGFSKNVERSAKKVPKINLKK